MASITQHRDGWRAQVYVRGERDSQVFQLKTQAKAWAAQRETELRNRKAGQLPRKSAIDAWRRYGQEVSPTHRGERWELYRLAAFERDAPFASKLLQDITPDDIGRWRDARLQFVKPASVRRDWRLMSAVFAQCCGEWGWLRDNPMSQAKCPEDSVPRTRRVSWREARAIARRLGVTGGPPENMTSETGLAFMIALATAMRSSEILGLRPEHIDLERRLYWLGRQKNGDPAGWHPFPRRAKRRMAQLKAYGQMRVSAGTRDKLFRDAIAALSIKDLHFHDSRAEATTLLSRRVDAMTLAKITRHKDLQVLLDTYYRETAEDIAARI